MPRNGSSATTMYPITSIATIATIASIVSIPLKPQIKSPLLFQVVVEIAGDALVKASGIYAKRGAV